MRLTDQEMAKRRRRRRWVRDLDSRSLARSFAWFRVFELGCALAFADPICNMLLAEGLWVGEAIRQQETSSTVLCGVCRVNKCIRGEMW